MDHRTEYKMKNCKTDTHKIIWWKNFVIIDQKPQMGHRNHESKKKKKMITGLHQHIKLLCIKSHYKENESSGHELGENIITKKSGNIFVARM